MIKLCVYFVIVTFEKMTAEEAYTLYKSRDGSEKLFRGDKSYLGAKSERVYSNELIDTKIFIEFVATIIRNRIYTCLKDEMDRQKKKSNFMAGYEKADWLKEGMGIDTSREPLDELKEFG